MSFPAPPHFSRRAFLKLAPPTFLLALGSRNLAKAAPEEVPTGRARSNKFVVGHRGAGAYAPENTLESYRLAIAQGAEYVEQDLQITRDGVLVCCHDESLERISNVKEVFPDRYE